MLHRLWFIGALASVGSLFANVVAIDTARAGGFYTPYHSSSALGTALAGASARTDDASFVFFNPALAAFMPGPAAAVDVRLFNPSAKIDVDLAVSPLGQNLTAAGGSGEMTDVVGAPAVYAAIPLNDWLSLAVAGASPFAVEIEADPTWAGRFHVVGTEMKTYEVSASLAARLAPWLAVSAGVQLQKFDGEFTKSELIPTPQGFAEVLGFLRGDDTSIGFIAGVAIQPMPGTRIGASYRSAITHELEGTAGAFTPFTPPVKVRFDADLPSIVTVGLEQRVTDRLRIFAEGAWMDWSRFKGFDIDFLNSPLPNDVRAQDWRDTWMAAFGFAYQLDAATEVTAGIAYDQSIAKGATNTLSPDGNRTMVSLGLRQQVSEGGSVALSYTHIFFEDAPIAIADPRTGLLNADFSSSLDIFGVTLNMVW